MLQHSLLQIARWSAFVHRRGEAGPGQGRAGWGREGQYGGGVSPHRKDGQLSNAVRCGAMRCDGSEGSSWPGLASSHRLIWVLSVWAWRLDSIRTSGALPLLCDALLDSCFVDR